MRPYMPFWIPIFRSLQMPAIVLRNISLKKRTLSMEVPKPPTKARTMPTISVTASIVLNRRPRPNSPNRTSTRLSNQSPEAEMLQETSFQPEIQPAKKHASNSNNATYAENIPHPPSLPAKLLIRFSLRSRGSNRNQNRINQLQTTTPHIYSACTPVPSL